MDKEKFECPVALSWTSASCLLAFSTRLAAITYAKLLREAKICKRAQFVYPSSPDHPSLAKSFQKVLTSSEEAPTSMFEFDSCVFLRLSGKSVKTLKDFAKVISVRPNNP